MYHPFICNMTVQRFLFDLLQLKYGSPKFLFNPPLNFKRSKQSLVHYSAKEQPRMEQTMFNQNAYIVNKFHCLNLVDNEFYVLHSTPTIVDTLGTTIWYPQQRKSVIAGVTFIDSCLPGLQPLSLITGCQQWQGVRKAEFDRIAILSSIPVLTFKCRESMKDFEEAIDLVLSTSS